VRIGGNKALPASAKSLQHSFASHPVKQQPSRPYVPHCHHGITKVVARPLPAGPPQSITLHAKPQDLGARIVGQTVVRRLAGDGSAPRSSCDRGVRLVVRRIGGVNFWEDWPATSWDRFAVEVWEAGSGVGFGPVLPPLLRPLFRI